MTLPNPAPGSAQLDPDLDAAALYRLAQSKPDLWVQIINHPNIYPDLLKWFEGVKRPDVQAALRSRRMSIPVSPPSTPPLPARGLPPVPSRATPPLPSQSRPPLPKQGTPPLPSRRNGEFIPPSGPIRIASDPPPFADSLTPAGLAPKQLPTSSPAAPVLEEPDDRTMLAKRSKRVLGTLTTGDQAIALLKERVVIGRKLRDHQDDDRTQLIRVPDPTRTISGTHAELIFKDGGWQIRDLDSTNGVYLVRPDGSEVAVAGSDPVEGDFYLGDVKFNLSKRS